MIRASIAKPSPPTRPAHAQPHHVLEQSSKQARLAEPAVAVLGKRRMIRDLAFEPQSAEPPVRQIEMHLLAQPPLGSDATAVADEQHAYHQLGINRRPAPVWL